MEPKLTAAEAADFLKVSVQAIHKQLKSKDMLFQKSQNRVFFGHSTAKKLFNIKFKQKIITVQIVKGGTGKTSLVHALAVRAHLYGARVLCIDLDQQGNLTQAFGVNPDEIPTMVDILNDQASVAESIHSMMPGLDLIPSRIENAVIDNLLMLKRLPLDRVYFDILTSVKKKYDLILIDCPPALGSSVAAAALASDLVISPVTPEKFCLSGLKITTQELGTLEKNHKKKIEMRIILNKFDSRTSLSHEVLSTLIKHPIFGERIYKTYIRSSQEFPNVIAKGGTIFDSLKETVAKEDIDLLTREILGLGTNNPAPVSLGSLEEDVVLRT